MSAKTIWDKHGNRIGEDVITNDRDGLTHITHYDNLGNRIGRSYETRDYKGEVYMIHEDAKGNRLGRSTVERDWWGDYYVKTEQTRFGREQAEAERKKKQEDDIGGNDTDDSAGIVGDALYGIVMLLLKVFAFVFIGITVYGAVVTAGGTIWMFLLMPVLNQSSHLSQIWPVFFVLVGAVILAYFPYLGILLYRRWKKKINWMGFFLAVLRWAIIGPFAYRWLLGKKKEKKNKEDNPHRPYDLPLWQCPTCGKNIFTAGRFCTDCGTERPETPSFITVDCPNCGKPIILIPGKEKTGICGECGHSYNFEQK